MLTLQQFIGPVIEHGECRLESHPLGGWRIRTDPDLGDKSPVIQHDDGTGLDKSEATQVLDELDNLECKGSKPIWRRTNL